MSAEPKAYITPATVEISTVASLKQLVTDGDSIFFKPGVQEFPKQGRIVVIFCGTREYDVFNFNNDRRWFPVELLDTAKSFQSAPKSRNDKHYLKRKKGRA